MSSIAKAVTEISGDEANKLAAVFLDQPEASKSTEDLLALQLRFGEVSDNAP